MPVEDALNEDTDLGLAPSRSCQSIVTLFRTCRISSPAITLSVSPIAFFALSLVARAS